MMRLDTSIVVTGFSSAHAGAVSELIEGAYTKEQLVQDMQERMAYVAVHLQKVVGVVLLAPGRLDPVKKIERIAVAPDYQEEGIEELLRQTAALRVSELGLKLE